MADLPEFDAAEYLDTSEAQAEYLRVSLEAGDSADIREAIDTVVRARGLHGTVDESITDRTRRARKVLRLRPSQAYRRVRFFVIARRRR